MVKVCPQVLTTGACREATCPFRHHVHICRPCGVVSFSAAIHQTHLKGRRHLNTIQGGGITLRCSICDIVVVGSASWKQHVSGRRHRQNVQDQGAAVDLEPEEATSQAGYNYCTVCKTCVQERFWHSHPNSSTHRRRIRFAKFAAAFDEAAKDKHGITVSHQAGGLDFGIIDIPSAQDGVSLNLLVKNSVPSLKAVLTEARVISSLQRTSPLVPARWCTSQ